MNGRNLRVLVTGAGGFVGRVVCAQLLAKSYCVRGTVRECGRHQLDDRIDAVQVASVDENTDWSEALANIDVVIHLAARVHIMDDDSKNPLEEFRRVNTAGTEHLARIAAAVGVKRMVYVSSIKVNGDATLGEKKLSESGEASPQDPYGISKWEAEKALHRVSQETGLEVVSVRPPLVYGPGVKGNFAQMMSILAKDIPLPLASVHNRRSLIYVDNLVDALILCATHPAVAGQTYLVSDGNVSTSDLLRQLGVAMGKPARLFYFPQFLLKLAGRLVGKSAQIERLLGSLQVDSSKIRRELGWKPPFTLQEGIRITGQSFLNLNDELDR